MKLRMLLAVITLGGLVLASALHHRPAVAQDEGGVIDNPDVYLPRDRRVPEVLYKVRQARYSELDAIRLGRQGKEEEARDKWLDAFGRYQNLRDEYLPSDLPPNREVLVRDEYFENMTREAKESVFSETWIPLADYINSRFRIREWPRPLMNRLRMQLAAPGEDMLRRAIADDNPHLLRRCARFYQFSESGRTALRLLAEKALERGDSVSAVRWLQDYMESWPDDFARDGSMQVLYVRACRDAGMAYRIGRTLRSLDRSGFSEEVDVGGVEHDSLELIRRIAARPAPGAAPELQPPGWRTLSGDVARNKVAPPVQSIGKMLDLSTKEDETGFELCKSPPGQQEQPGRHSGQEPPPLPVVFPAAHETGFFIHSVPEESGDSDTDSLMWFRHGTESNPVELKVPNALRYKPQQSNQNRWWRRTQESRTEYRVLGSSIGKLRWDLDNREGDVLFALMGPGQPTQEKQGEPSGTQIQGFDLSHDAALRVTLPNKKVESEKEWDFLKHVVFCGAPLVRDNKLYIAGAYTEKDTFEVWMVCFDVTPKGDPSEGEGKMLWRTQVCSKKIQSQRWGRWGGEPVKLPEISSVAEQGGMLYVATHAGCTAGVDRITGEICWISRYSRQTQNFRNGWFNNAPIAAGGFVVMAPYDYRLAIILDAVTGTHWMEFPKLGKGAVGDYEHVLGVIDNRMIVQGRTRLYSVGLTEFRQGGTREANWGDTHYEAEYAFGEEPTGRGVIAGDSVLVPFSSHIAIYDVNSGKLKTKARLDGVKTGDLPVTLTVYCRGESYKDSDGLTRYHPVTLTDPKTGNVYNVEHLKNGETFTFPSGGAATVKKETFVILASAQWAYVFEADDGGNE